MRTVRLLAALAALLTTAGIAWGASLGVSSSRLTVDSPEVCTLGAEADTWVDQSSPGTNFGGDGDLAVRSLALANRRALLRFDLSTCNIPSDATVNGATLNLYLSSAPSLSRIWGAHRVEGAWSETGVTWDTQPAAALTATDSVETGTTDGVTLQAEVTADVTAFVDGTATNHGWRVQDTLEGEALEQEGLVSSREHLTSEEHPVLVVKWE